MNGLWTFITPDSQPIVGKSIKFKNLYYNLGGCTEVDIGRQVRHANFIREQIARDIIQVNNSEVKKENMMLVEPLEMQALRPARFMM